jgi:phosphoesterase RecJ-like protein
VISLPKDFDTVLVALSSALYSYILTRHKKVTLYCQKSDLSRNLHFLPWIDKLKNSYPSSADLEIELSDADGVFDFFRDNDIKLNKKISTALYGAFVLKNNSFSRGVDGMSFAFAKELLEAGADVSSCNEFLINYNSLSSLRLKSILLKKLKLINSGEVALIELEDEDFQASGATFEDSKVVLKDALSLPTVNRVIVKYKNKEIIYEGEIL